MSLTIGVYKIPLSSQANRPNLLYLDISNPSSLWRRGVCCEKGVAEVAGSILSYLSKNKLKTY
jgi:hypothetical protein